MNKCVFDNIKHHDEKGDYWYARELMGIIGYKEWRTFSKIISKAILFGPYEFEQTIKTVNIARSVKRKIVDYRLTKRACYLVFLNCNCRMNLSLGLKYFKTDFRYLNETEVKDIEGGSSFNFGKIKFNPLQMNNL